VIKGLGVMLLFLLLLKPQCHSATVRIFLSVRNEGWESWERVFQITATVHTYIPYICTIYIIHIIHIIHTNDTIHTPVSEAEMGKPASKGLSRRCRAALISSHGLTVLRNTRARIFAKCLYAKCLYVQAYIQAYKQTHTYIHTHIPDLYPSFVVATGEIGRNRWESVTSAIMPVAKTALRACLRPATTNCGKLQSRYHSRYQSRYHSRYHSSVSGSPSPSPSLSVAKLLATPADDGEREVFGFVRSIRKQKTRAFASIGDGTSLEPLQAMLTPAQAQRYRNHFRIPASGTM